MWLLVPGSTGTDTHQCDKGEPCAGCQPSRASLWQVPCTRVDIEDMDYFMRDWQTDIERRVSFGFQLANIKGFDEEEKVYEISHGYSHTFPVKTRKVHYHDDSHLDVEWTESVNGVVTRFTVATEAIACGMEGISISQLSKYVDLHVDSGFIFFISNYFQDMPFNVQLLATIYRYYLHDRELEVRNAL